MDEKNLKKMNVMRDYLQKSAPSCGCYVYGNIPHTKVINACNEYAGNIDYSEVIGLIDETVFGSAKRGFIFTFDGFYYNGSVGITPYEKGVQFSQLSSLYNLDVFNSMLRKLEEIVTYKTTWQKIGDFAQGVCDVLEDEAESLNEDVEIYKQFKEHITYWDNLSYTLKSIVRLKEDDYIDELEGKMNELTNYFDEIENEAEFVDSLISDVMDENNSATILYDTENFIQDINRMENLPLEDIDDFIKAVEYLKDVINDYLKEIKPGLSTFRKAFQRYEKELYEAHPYLSLLN